jgi:adenylate kinase family enzyme
MPDIYCGIAEKIPKNSVRGTATECVVTGQIRYYGLKPITKDIIKKAKQNMQKSPSMLHREKTSVFNKITKYRVRSIAIKKKLDKKKYKNDTEKNKIIKEMNEYNEKLQKLTEIYKKIEKEYNKVKPQLEYNK